MFIEITPIVTLISLIFGIMVAVLALKDKIFEWAKEDIGNYWEMQDLRAMLVELKIRLAIKDNDKLEYILKLKEDYTNIPQKNQKERNGHITHIISKYKIKLDKKNKVINNEYE